MDVRFIDAETVVPPKNKLPASRNDQRLHDIHFPMSNKYNNIYLDVLLRSKSYGYLHL